MSVGFLEMHHRPAQSSLYSTRRVALGQLLSLAASTAMVTPSAAEAVSVHDFGAVGDGATDDTTALIRAHQSGRPVHYVKPQAHYRITRTLPVLADVTADQGATIIMDQNGQSERTFFRVRDNTAPITISGLTLDGGYSGGNVANFSMGIDLRAASNVTIKNNAIQNILGDCIYIGRAWTATGAPASRAIKIVDNELINPRRCNVAVVSGEDVTIANNRMRKPVEHVGSIDLEPDPNGTDYVRRVTVSNNSFETNGQFLSISVNNGIANSGLIIQGNKGTAHEFVHVYSNALLDNPQFLANEFVSDSSSGCMFTLWHMPNGTIAQNVDKSACGNGYKSISLLRSDPKLEGNKFCAPG